MSIAQLPVSNKISIGFGFMILSVIGAGVFCWIMMHLIDGEWNKVAVVVAEKKTAVAGMATHLQRADAQVLRHLQRKADAQASVTEEMRLLSAFLSRYRNAGSISADEAQNLSELAGHLKQHAELVTRANLQTDGAETANMAEKLAALETTITATLARLDSIISRQADLASKQVTWLVAISKTIISVLTVIVSAIAVLIAWALVRGITRPLQQVLQATDNLRAGEADLTQRLPEFDAEFGKIAHSFNGFVEKLDGNIARVREVSESINIGTKEIVAGNRHLAERTERDGAALEELASTIDEVTTSAKQNAESATAANKLASSTATAATQGGEIVGRLIETMEEINDSAGQIEEIVRLIDSIAFQTNILALNAAVEAARAGEQGLGFAVVAAEVRALAQRSAAAARDVKMLIRANVTRGQTGGQLADDAGNAMSAIVERIQHVSELMAGIKLASHEQSIAFEQVHQAIVHLEESAQQRAALTEQSSATAAQFEQHGRHLLDVVQSFRVSSRSPVDGESRPSPAADDWRKPPSDSGFRALPAHARSHRRLR